MTPPHICLLALYSDQQPADAEPTAILALQAALEAAFSRLEIEWLTVSEADVQRKLKAMDARFRRPGLLWIGISVPQGTLSLARQVIRQISTVVPNLPLVLGHAVPTSGAREVLDEFPQAVVVSGWGEQAACALTSLLLKTRRWPADELRRITGVSFRCEGKLHLGKSAAPSARGMPKRPPGHQRLFFPRVEASRGCSYNRCTFCSRPMSCSPDDSWVPFPVEQVLEEVRLLSAAGIGRFTFADEDFFGKDRRRVDSLLDGLAAIGSVRFSLSSRLDDFFYSNESSRRAVDERLKRLKRAGLSLLFIGLESLSDTQLVRYQKGYTSARAGETIRYLTETHRVPVELGFILFDPFTSVLELRENLGNLRALGIAGIIGQPFNELRVRRNTPYMDRVAAASLLKGYSADEAEYAYSFQCPKVAMVHKACLVWKDALDAEYLSVRNVKRTTFHDRVVEKSLKNYRETELQLLEIWINAAESGDTQEASRRCRRLTAQVRESLRR